jgi:hypothetical protein
VTQDTEEKPFWWRHFDDSVEVVSDKLREAIVRDEAEQIEKIARSEK